jgi:membrane-associated phospholipid phosphatase
VSRLHPRRVFLVSGGLFLALAVLVALVGVFPGDLAVRDTLLALATPPLVAFLRLVNRAGHWRVLLPGTLLLYVLPRARVHWMIWPAMMLSAPICEGLLKITVARPRPEGVAYGFPSGHATAAAAFFGAVIYLSGFLAPRSRAALRLGAATMLILVALARVVLRAHWPSDVLGGIALGLALASAAALLDSLERSPASPRAALPNSEV